MLSNNNNFQHAQLSVLHLKLMDINPATCLFNYASVSAAIAIFKNY